MTWLTQHAVPVQLVCGALVAGTLVLSIRNLCLARHLWYARLPDPHAVCANCGHPRHEHLPDVPLCLGEHLLDGKRWICGCEHFTEPQPQEA
jgi:hypothetical protein